jgi:hypothetical protein
MPNDSSGQANALRWSAAFCVLIAALLWVGPFLLRADLFAGDAAQHVFWLYRYLNPVLFPHDLSVDYFSSVSVAPWGYRALYAVLTRFIDPQIAAEWVAIVLLLVSGLLAWLLGASMSDEQPEHAGLFAVLALIALLPFPATDLLPAMGFQRTFALPLTLACVLALARRRFAWVGVTWILAGLFYPIILPLLGVTSACVFAEHLWRERRMPPAWIWNGALGLAAVALVLVGARMPANLGPTATYAQALAMPEFGPRGRMVIFDGSWSRYWLGDHHIGLGWSPRLLICLLVCLGIVVVLGRRRLIPRVVWMLLASGVGLWLVARWVMFALYMPNRHARWAMAVFGIVVLAAAALSIFGRKRGAEWALGVSFAAPILSAALLLPSAWRVWTSPVDQDLENAYRFIASLPIDTLVAAHPDLADFIPLRTRRSVLASTEESQPFVLGFYQKMKPLVEDSLRGAYATRWSEIDNILGARGVDAILTAPSVWVANDYFEPFSSLVHQLREEGIKNGFALKHPPPERILFRSGDVYVVRVVSTK